jgi:hypothetical protein
MGLAIVSFFRWGHRGAKYGTATTLSSSLATGGGDKEDTGVCDDGRSGREARLERRSLVS